MDISSVSNLYAAPQASPSPTRSSAGEGFDKVLDSVMGLVKETDQLQHDANAQEISFMLGESDNVHDLMIAEQKANIALQYTIAVRDRFIEAYNNIMNMQI